MKSNCTSDGSNFGWAHGTKSRSTQPTTKLAPGWPPGQFGVPPRDPLKREHPHFRLDHTVIIISRTIIFIGSINLGDCMIV